LKSFILRAAASVFAAALVFALPAHAQVTSARPTQSPSAPTPKSAITGVVVDSLHNDFLIGAEVIIQGLQATVFTDSLGRFRVDSVSPGTYQVGIFHPLLDTLGISLATRPFHLGPDSASVVVLAVPSAATLVARSCEVRPRAQGNSAVIGQVIDPETLQPVPGADVSIAWVEIAVSKELGIRQTPRVLRDSTDNLGRYSLCGLPNSLEASLQAQRGGSLTAQITVSLGDAPTELLARTLLLSRADSNVKVGKAVVSGRVLLEGNMPTSGSRVELVGTNAVTTTNEKGEFTLRDLPSGTHMLVARHLGYAPDAVAVDLSSRQPKSVTITLPKFVNIMDPVLVTARRNASLDRVGFVRRRRSGGGYYLGPEQIDRMKPVRLTDILRQVPGLRISYSPEGETVSSSRGATSIMGASCVQYVVDEVRWQSMQPGDINAFVSGHEVVAVEVYQGAFTPAQYGGSGNCTTIVLWTRMRIRD
jgi:hypothetical protein